MRKFDEFMEELFSCVADFVMRLWHSFKGWIKRFF